VTDVVRSLLDHPSLWSTWLNWVLCCELTFRSFTAHASPCSIVWWN